VILEYGFTELEYGFNELCIVYRIACEIFFLRIPRGKKLGPPLPPAPPLPRGTELQPRRSAPPLVVLASDPSHLCCGAPASASHLLKGHNDRSQIATYRAVLSAVSARPGKPVIGRGLGR
jgi:hypothetical protein